MKKNDGSNTVTSNRAKLGGYYDNKKHDTVDIPCKMPSMPKGLSPKSKAAWREVSVVLEEYNIVSLLDGVALRLLCDSIALYLKAEESIADKGLMITSMSTKGDITEKSNPAIRIRDNAWQQIFTMSRQFGMTPLSRKRNYSQENTENKSPMDMLMRTLNLN